MNKKNKIKIMHLRSSYQYSKVLYGAEKIILDICRFVDKDKFMQQLVTLIDERTKGDLPLKIEAEKNHIPVKNVRLKHKYDLGAASEVKKLLIEQNIDILHCHDYKSNLIGLFAARGLNIKVISTVHGYLSVGIKMRLYEMLDRYILRYFDKIIAVSEALAHFLKGKVKENALLVIPNGINIEDFSRETDVLKKKREIGIDERDLVVGTVGRISPEKGHIYFLKAAKELCKRFKNVVFLLVGEGPLERKLKKWVSKNNLSNRILFPGSVKNIENILHVFDVFVLPSKKEAFGLSILEAMACGKPIIASNTGGIPCIIENRDIGILVANGDVTMLSQEIWNLLNNEKLRQKIGYNSQQYAKDKYSVNNMVGKYEKLYVDLTL